jgi:hypothetical protein
MDEGWQSTVRDHAADISDGAPFACIFILCTNDIHLL